MSAMVWLPTGIAFNEYFYSLKYVAGRSMQPTLNPDDSSWQDIVLFDHFTVNWLQKYERGDIVALKSPHEGKLIVKRIVALPGDTIKTLPPYPDAEVHIPEGHAWVEGDEPFRSEDSNYFGPIPLGLVQSKLSVIVWPLNRTGPILLPGDPNRPKPKTGPAWRRERDEVDRQTRRQARVTEALNSPRL
ncbi:uncharacterized protein PHACADRAFT_86447 [Phanerochaete carnosa HHB-10118-sp]|uniref:Mitochondrial inner membrane protease subunit n=1 Tax=Phanerochaete carnosa (strain HHB-10118-sp) TaxID=650164 RepID=K5WJ36_PHACS|nr:uncharacterized protein PHACADRAFT_86447 [Phanerochaete carnosa HHB-10118-sp]EKM59380.1 hypothetical protein PHACADRAFT_86447 [Phanerochaete carnosa HHB-10118-sp]